MVKKYFLPNLIFFLALVLGGCASGERKERNNLREAFRKKDFKKSLTILKSEKMMAAKNSRLLTLMEAGVIHHVLGNYQKSINALEQAKTLSQKLYTKRISQKISSMVVNDNTQDYYGPLYERSLIYFYQSLNHYLLYQQNGKKVELRRSRANILAWDSMIKSFRHTLVGESAFKDDMMGKIFGAFIMEANGGNANKQIALQLYKDALTLLFRNYNAYRSFNNKSEAFSKNFSDLPKMKIAKIKQEFIDSSDYAKSLTDFLHFKILELTKIIRPFALKKAIKLYNPAPHIIKKIKRLKRLSNVALVFQRGMVASKIPSKFNFGLAGAMNSSKDAKTRKLIGRFGVHAMMGFAQNQLGLRPGQGVSGAGALLGVAVSAATSTAAIAFELPTIEKKDVIGYTFVEVYDQQGKLQRKEPVILVNPVGDIAAEAVSRESAANYIKTGTRVALKHAGAIAAAYLTYQTTKGNNIATNYLAKNAAIASYLLLSRGIDASEKADIRYWSTLPNSLRVGSFYLPKGKYNLKLIESSDSEGRSLRTKYNLGDLTIDNPNKRYLVNFRN